MDSSSIEGEAIYAAHLAEALVTVLVGAGLVPKETMFALLDSILMTLEGDALTPGSRSIEGRAHTRARLANLISTL